MYTIRNFKAPVHIIWKKQENTSFTTKHTNQCYIKGAKHTLFKMKMKMLLYLRSYPDLYNEKHIQPNCHP